MTGPAAHSPADGRMLLFAADVAMGVHALDPASLFPCKQPARAELFGAFEAALRRRASGAVAGLRSA